MPSFVVPQRFTEAVVLHLMRCFCMDPDFGSGQILLITGAPGSGKTFQLYHTLAQAGVRAVGFDAGDVESASANEPVRRLVSRMEAVTSAIRSRVPSALVIDDAHLLLGRFELTQYTHNLQRIVAELMRAATAVNLSNGTAVAAPMILVANRADLFDSAMIRHGRARHLHWDPTCCELELVVQALFPQMVHAEISTLLNQFAGEQVSFFSALRDAMIDEYLLLRISKEDYGAALRTSLTTRERLRPELMFSFQDALRVGETIRSERARWTTPVGGKLLVRESTESDGRSSDGAIERRPLND